MEYFSINKETPLIIYGFGNIGKKKCRLLLDAGYKVVCIIDQNAENLPLYEEIPIVTLDMFHNRYESTNNFVIIICLNNGMQHEKVAETLLSYNYSRILYIPMNTKREYRFLEEMQKAYVSFSENRFVELTRIPITSVCEEEKSENRRVLSCESEYITFLCEIEFLYSPNEEMIKDNSANISILENALRENKYVDKPIVMCENYLNLFDYIMGKVDYPDLYMEFFGKDDNYNRKLLHDRLRLFQCYEHRYAEDIRLFYIQPTTVIWNDKGYFNIYDGVHRLMYLYYVKNHLKIPVRTTKKSYNSFLKCMKKNEMIYKSAELIFQEKIFRYFDVFNAEGALIGKNLYFDFFVKNSKKLYFYKKVEDVFLSNQNYDYILIKSYVLVQKDDLISILLKHTSRLIIEATGSTFDISALPRKWGFAKLGTIFDDDLNKVDFYLVWVK